MSEKVVVTLLNNPFTGSFPMDRDEFYDEQIAYNREGKEVDKAISIIDVILFNEAGELIIQKRAKHKRHNKNMMDKSIGGHVTRGDPVDHTVMTETVQELQVPSIVIREDDDFEKRFTLLKDYVSTIALVKHMDTRIFRLKNVMNEGDITVAKKVYFYLGVYGGKVKNIDKEAKGILFYNLDDLKEEMEEHPKMFTDDLHTFIHEYEPQIRAFIELITKK